MKTISEQTKFERLQEEVCHLRDLLGDRGRSLRIMLGLALRKFSGLLPGLVHKNLGDLLWAAAVFFIVAILLPRASTFLLAAVAFTFCCCIEANKLFHVSWFDAICATGIGRLIFGNEALSISKWFVREGRGAHLQKRF